MPGRRTKEFLHKDIEIHIYIYICTYTHVYIHIHVYKCVGPPTPWANLECKNAVYTTYPVFPSTVGLSEGNLLNPLCAFECVHGPAIKTLMPMCL